MKSHSVLEKQYKHFSIGGAYIFVGSTMVEDKFVS